MNLLLSCPVPQPQFASVSCMMRISQQQRRADKKNKDDNNDSTNDNDTGADTIRNKERTTIFDRDTTTPRTRRGETMLVASPVSTRLHSQVMADLNEVYRNLDFKIPYISGHHNKHVDCTEQQQPIVDMHFNGEIVLYYLVLQDTKSIRLFANCMLNLNNDNNSTAADGFESDTSTTTAGKSAANNTTKGNKSRQAPAPPKANTNVNDNANANANNVKDGEGIEKYVAGIVLCVGLSGFACSPFFSSMSQLASEMPLRLEKSVPLLKERIHKSNQNAASAALARMSLDNSNSNSNSTQSSKRGGSKNNKSRQQRMQQATSHKKASSTKSMGGGAGGGGGGSGGATSSSSTTDSEASSEGKKWIKNILTTLLWEDPSVLNTAHLPSKEGESSSSCATTTTLSMAASSNMSLAAELEEDGAGAGAGGMTAVMACRREAEINQLLALYEPDMVLTGTMMMANAKSTPGDANGASASAGGTSLSLSKFRDDGTVTTASTGSNSNSSYSRSRKSSLVGPSAAFPTNIGGISTGTSSTRSSRKNTGPKMQGFDYVPPPTNRPPAIIGLDSILEQKQSSSKINNNHNNPISKRRPGNNLSIRSGSNPNLSLSTKPRQSRGPSRQQRRTMQQQQQQQKANSNTALAVPSATNGGGSHSYQNYPLDATTTTSTDRSNNAKSSSNDVGNNEAADKNSNGDGGGGWPTSALELSDFPVHKKPSSLDSSDALLWGTTAGGQTQTDVLSSSWAQPPAFFSEATANDTKNNDYANAEDAAAAATTTSQAGFSDWGPAFGEGDDDHNGHLFAASTPSHSQSQDASSLLSDNNKPSPTASFATFDTTTTTTTAATISPSQPHQEQQRKPSPIHEEDADAVNRENDGHHHVHVHQASTTLVPSEMNRHHAKEDAQPLSNGNHHENDTDKYSRNSNPSPSSLSAMEMETEELTTATNDEMILGRDHHDDDGDVDDRPRIALTVGVALNEDLTVSYRSSKLTNATVDGLIQVRKEEYAGMHACMAIHYTVWEARYMTLGSHPANIIFFPFCDHSFLTYDSDASQVERQYCTLHGRVGFFCLFERPIQSHSCHERKFGLRVRCDIGCRQRRWAQLFSGCSTEYALHAVI
jgi:hypothetical protein